MRPPRRATRSCPVGVNVWRTCAVVAMLSLSQPIASAQDTPAAAAAIASGTALTSVALPEAGTSSGSATSSSATSSGATGDADTARASSSAPPKPLAFRFERRPVLSIGHEVSVEFAARLEGDLRPPSADVGQDSTYVGWGTRRLGVEGSISKRIRFEASGDIGGEKTAWKDVDASVRIAHAFEVQASSS